MKMTLGQFLQNGSMKRGKSKTARRRYIYDYCGGTCAYCNKPIRFEDSTLDHVTPRCKMTSTDNSHNLIIACEPCNHEKGCGTFIEFLGLLPQYNNWMTTDETGRKAE